MVHALKEAWRVLVPRGIMMDIRPLSVDTPLEVVYSNECELAGMVDMSPDLEYDIAADRAIEIIRKDKCFSEQKIDHFDYIYYWKTFHGMIVDFEERWKDEIIVSNDVIDKAKHIYEEKRPDVMLRLRMSMKAGKYEKLG